MNDAALGCFIERRNEAANLFCIRLGGATDTFLQCAQPSPNTAVLVSASERLPGTFHCGFGIGHGIAENLRGVDARADGQNVKISILNQARGPDAILVCEESRFGPEAGASKP